MIDSMSMFAFGCQSQPGAPQGGLLDMLFPMVVVFAIFYLVLIRPQMRKEKQKNEMIKNVKTGDKVIFSGGMIGVVSNVKDKTIMVKVADNVKVEIVKGAILKVIEKDDQISTEISN